MSRSILRIGVNAYEANVTKRVGSNMFAYQLLLELEKQTRPSDDPILQNLQPIEWTIYLPTAPLADLPKERAGWQYVIATPAFLWTQWRLPLALYQNKKNLDVFVSLGHYSPLFSPVPTLMCVLDLAFLKFPQFFRKKDLYQLTNWTKRSILQAAHIFTISNASKKDIVEIYKRSDSDISIIYPGTQNADTDKKDQFVLPEAQLSKLMERFTIHPRNYIVSVGTIQPRKNMISVIKAFEIFNERKTGRYKLVFVGKAGWMTEEFDKAVQESSQKHNIIVTGFVSDDIKYSLLRFAAASVLVGYYEGFGIPVVESLNFGVTPVVANTASLPEVVGDFGVLVDPYNIDDIAHGFDKAVATIPNPEHVAKMKLWAQQFSWITSGAKIISVLRQKFGSASS